MIIPAQEIEGRCIVRPFNQRKLFGGMTYGLGPAGYDVRNAQSMVLKPGAFALSSTIEEFHIPDDLVGFVFDKSTWARRGLSLFNTVLEPGWKGFLTLELVNLSRKTLEINAGMPIAQVMFQKLTEPTSLPYKGKYQNQMSGPQPAILE